MLDNPARLTIEQAAHEVQDEASRLAHCLEEQILAGELKPGSRLPSERAISAEMGVSRSVVREAIGRLAALGLVRSVHGSGTRVLAPSGRLIEVGLHQLLGYGPVRLHHLAEMRLPLETAMAEAAARHRTAEHLTALDQTQQILANSRRPLEAHARADLTFHAILAEASGNPLFALVLTPIQELLIESRRRTLGRYGVELAFRHHARILDAVRDQDPVRAAAAMREHLKANLQHLRGEKKDPSSFA